ncbi:MAG: hypothetical protein ACXVB0_01680 [Mucilaginibacter sp.]
MLNEENLINRLKSNVEQRVDWGDSKAWVNQDFIALSDKVLKETGATISHVTLKRIWGKVKYDGSPQVYTLNTLSKFVGYESWRDFIVKNNDGNFNEIQNTQSLPESEKKKSNKWIVPFAVTLFLIVIILLVIAVTKRQINPSDFSLTAHTTTGKTIPNSVVFDYDATNASDDSVIIQQSWDTRLRTSVSKYQHQHTLIYYYPGFFQPKLIVGGRVAKEYDLLIPSNGWVTAIMHSPIPVYFKKQDVINNGYMSLSTEKIKAEHVLLNPDVPSLSYCNVKDFGPIYSDDFEFETSVRNDFREGSSVCQLTNIYLLCQGTAINIPLCSRGCESSLNFFFTDYSVSGKQRDLSGFGVDFKDFVKIKVNSSKGKAYVYLNNQLVYTVNQGITHSKIIGIDYVFQGTGSVDYVKLKNKSVSFDDEF